MVTAKTSEKREAYVSSARLDLIMASHAQLPLILLLSVAHGRGVSVMQADREARFRLPIIINNSISSKCFFSKITAYLDYIT